MIWVEAFGVKICILGGRPESIKRALISHFNFKIIISHITYYNLLIVLLQNNLFICINTINYTGLQKKKINK